MSYYIKYMVRIFITHIPFDNIFKKIFFNCRFSFDIFVPFILACERTLHMVFLPFSWTNAPMWLTNPILNALLLSYSKEFFVCHARLGWISLVTKSYMWFECCLRCKVHSMEMSVGTKLSMPTICMNNVSTTIKNNRN